jgi:hypothetical protein
MWSSYHLFGCSSLSLGKMPIDKRKKEGTDYEASNAETPTNLFQETLEFISLLLLPIFIPFMKIMSMLESGINLLSVSIDISRKCTSRGSRVPCKVDGLRHVRFKKVCHRLEGDMSDAAAK